MLQHGTITAQGRGAFQTFHIVHGLAAGLGHSGPFAFFFAHFVDLGAQGAHPGVQAGFAGLRLASQYGVDALKQPGVAQRAAADHHARAAGLLQNLLCAFRRGDIAVCQHRNADRFADLRDGIHINGRDVHLLPRAAMHGDQVCTVCFTLPGHGNAGQLLGIPANAHFNGQRLIRPQGSAGSGHHAAAQLRVLHQFAACTAGCDLGGRATHVDVQNIKLHAFFLNDPDSLRHRFGLGPKQLHGINAVGGLVPQQAHAFVIAKGNGLGAGHLAYRPRRAMVRHQVPARRIRKPRHRRKHRRLCIWNV